MNNITELSPWLALTHHQRDIASEHMRDWFASDATRFSRLSLQVDEILLDYSRNRINEKTIPLLKELAQTVDLPQKMAALFAGLPINTTEKRPALHTALRDKSQTPIFVNGTNIAPIIQETMAKMRHFVGKIHSHELRGSTGKPFTDIVNIGIGGSYIGPEMCSHALKDYTVANLKLHFISSVDSVPLNELLQRINPETTLFIISSKSFTTIETLTNTQTALNWMNTCLGSGVLPHHFVAVTAAADKALALGIPNEHIFPLWDWVGGRYSIWSAIGLPLMLLIGGDHFAQFLDGAYQMDCHFKSAPFEKNMPILLAMLGIWYMNFFGSKVQAIIPYAHRLSHFIPYLQQVEMESNGKRNKLNGADLDYLTSSVIFGEEGCKGQHAYHQLLHQGPHLIPVDFLLVGETINTHREHQDILLASALSQAQALMRGKTYAEAYEELIHSHTPAEATLLAPHRMIPGNRPSNILFLDRVSPKNLGALIALYEHKIFVQGIIWDINSFDQWGVELGKQLLPHILHSVQGHSNNEGLDSATCGLIKHFKKIQGD